MSSISQALTDDKASRATIGLSELFHMAKPGVALLVVVTAVPGLLMASSTIPSPVVALGALLGTVLLAASGSIFNQMIDAGIDGAMKRTSARPIVTGKLSIMTAGLFATFLMLSGFSLAYFLATPLAAWIALAGNAFYVFVYSLILKKRTSQNIVIGGAAGAVGPLIGWAAVAGDVSLSAWLMFLIIFLWTPPHFWALALKYKDDYALANIPMLPVVVGIEKTKVQIFAYSLTLIIPVVALYFLQSTSLAAFSILLALTLLFIAKAWQLLRSPGIFYAMPVFHFSCLYLFLVFAVLSVDRLAFLLI